MPHDLKCPKCGFEEGPFVIEATITTMIHLYEDGTDDPGGDTEWSDDSYCRCTDCDHDGVVADFSPHKPTRPADSAMTVVEERIATFLWTQSRSGQWDSSDFEEDLDHVLADMKNEQDFDDAAGDRSCGEAGTWEDCCEIARSLVAGKRQKNTQRSFAHVTIPDVVGPVFAITPTAYWKRHGYLYDDHFDIPDKRFVALMESYYEFDGSLEEGRQALLDLGYEEDEYLRQFAQDHGIEEEGEKDETPPVTKPSSGEPVDLPLPGQLHPQDDDDDLS